MENSHKIEHIYHFDQEDGLHVEDTSVHTLDSPTTLPYLLDSLMGNHHP